MTNWRRNYPYSDRIYEAQPYLYGFFGLCTMLWFRNLAAVASGVIFIFAGLLVWYWRYRYRRAFIQSHQHIEVPTIFREEAPSHGLAELSWRDVYGCGHPVIDAQHRRLFGLCNVLINMIAQDASQFEVERELVELIDHVKDHFCTEEALLARTKHPLSGDHQRQHAQLLEKAESLKEHYAKNQVTTNALVRFVAYDLVAQHIYKGDLEWAVAR